MAIYVNFEKPRTVNEFLIKFYSFRTTYGYAQGYNTYYDKECTKLHCSKSYRSFDDLLELVQTYYPSIKPLKLMHYLLKLKIKDNRPDRGFFKPHLGTCNTMGRIRYIPYGEASYTNITMRMTNSKYTWSELLKPLGINNLNKFREYIK